MESLKNTSQIEVKTPRHYIMYGGVLSVSLNSHNSKHIYFHGVQVFRNLL